MVTCYTTWRWFFLGGNKQLPLLPRDSPWSPPREKSLFITSNILPKCKIEYAKTMVVMGVFRLIRWKGPPRNFTRRRSYRGTESLGLGCLFMLLPGLQTVLSKLQTPDQGSHAAHLLPLHCTALFPTLSLSSPPLPCVFLCLKYSSPPDSPAPPVALSLNAVSPRKFPSFLTASDAPALHSCISPAKHPVLFILYHLACLSSTRPATSQRQGLRLPCPPVCTQKL